MDVNDKAWTDLDRYRGSNLGIGVYAVERYYPKVGVCQIWKQYFQKLKTYAHLWKLKHCANADMDADGDRPQHKRQRLGDNISSPWAKNSQSSFDRLLHIKFGETGLMVSFKSFMILYMLWFMDITLEQGW